MLQELLCPTIVIVKDVTAAATETGNVTLAPDDKHFHAHKRFLHKHHLADTDIDCTIGNITDLYQHNLPLFQSL